MADNTQGDFAQPLAGQAQQQVVNIANQVSVAALKHVEKAGTQIDAAVRSSLNLIEGTGVTLTVADNSGGDRVDVTVGLDASPIRKTTAETVNDTTTETDLLNGEFTVAANLLGTEDGVRLTAEGDWVCNGGSSSGPLFKLKLGSTTLINTGNLGANIWGWHQVATRFPWRATATIRNLGATNVQSVEFEMSLAGGWSSGSSAASGNNVTTGEGVVWGVGGNSQGHIGVQAFNTAAIDTTADQTLALTVTNPAASTAYEVKLYSALAEII